MKPIPESAPTGTADPYRRRWAIWAAVGLGTYMNVLDNSMMTVTLPTVSREFGVDVNTIQWVMTGYMLVISSLLLTGARLADVYGRKRLYLSGIVIFAIASTLAGFALDAYQLISFRMLQGIGSALVQGIGTAVVVSAFPARERGRALGLSATTVALGGISGPVLGGLIADLLGWRWIFWLRIPVAIGVLIATWRVFPRDGHEARETRFDVPGAATLFLALCSLLLGLNQGRLWGWGSLPILALLGGALLLLVLFVRIEMRAPAPMLPLAVFRNWVFATASASSFLTFLAISSSFFMMPFFLIQGLNLTPSSAGLLLVPGAVLMSTAAPISGALSDRFGSRVLSPIGLVIVIAALSQLAGLTSDAGPLDVVWRSALLGLGMGTFMSPNNNALMGSVPREQIGLAAGAMASVRNLGNVVGVALAGTVLTNREAFHLPLLREVGLAGQQLASGALIAGIKDAFVVAAGVATLALVVTLVRTGKRPPAPTPDTASGSAR